MSTYVEDLKEDICKADYSESAILYLALLSYVHYMKINCNVDVIDEREKQLLKAVLEIKNLKSSIKNI